jgi:hypothetical protein
MISYYPIPTLDPRFGELEILIAKQSLMAKQDLHQKREKAIQPLRTQAGQTQGEIDRCARIKSETSERKQARKELLRLGIRPV